MRPMIPITVFAGFLLLAVAMAWWAGLLDEWGAVVSHYFF